MKKNHKLILALIGLFSFQTNLLAFDFTALPAVPNKIDGKYFNFELKPGESSQDSLIITNTGKDPGTYKIDAVDTIASTDGQMGFNLPNNTQKTVGKWITLEEREITLEPNESKTIGFSIQIPADQELNDYTGGVTVTTKGGTQKDEDQKVTIGINQRYAIKTFVKVTNDPQPFEKATIVKSSSSNWIQYYLLASVGIFVITILVLGINSAKKRRGKATK